MYKNTLVTVLVFLLVFVFFVNVVFADDVDDIYEKMKEKSKIAEQIGPDAASGKNATEILSEIEEKVSNGVATVRVVATIFAVVFFIWMGFVLFLSSGNPQKLSQVKLQFTMFCLSLICIFMAEPIVRFILSWFY